MIKTVSGYLQETTDDDGKRLAYVEYSGDSNFLWLTKEGKVVFGINGEPYLEVVQYVPDDEKVALALSKVRRDEDGNHLFTVKRYPITSFSISYLNKEVPSE